MNKKHIMHILILLIIIKNVFSQSIINKTHNVKSVIDYWAQEKMLNAKPKLSPIGKLNKTTSINEKGRLLASVSDSDSINLNVESDNLLTVGKLFFTSYGVDSFCTASVIDTSDGNTGITAAHCLYDDGLSVPKSYIESGDDDYAAIKFDYPGKLQLQTGSFGWGLTPPSPVSIAIFGYPYNGDMNCVTNGQNCCVWRGYATLEYPYGIPEIPEWSVPLRIGSGASGGPWIMKNNLPNYLGYLIGVTEFYMGENNEYADPLNFTFIRILIDWP
ncbi:41926_t:CDS:2 [Gigaspora margarita]|uniref:41926_t:CDS:1 n=1 Tax=Gigaspora margarita TaxID=4874 RepID=A0ABN7UER3_GIGMA|nr:41926_t:CDS:2 [Gigaspora margarita]